MGYNFETKLAVLVLGLCVLLPVAAQDKKPSINIGVLAHAYLYAQQNDFGSATLTSDSKDWSMGANLYRARLMFDVQLSARDHIFAETEITAGIGPDSDKAASIKVLDMQYDHRFFDWLTVSAGKMLVSYNRNGLQTASTLMANDFSYFQYPYNMNQESPLQNDCGRDVGVNLSGGIVNDKLKYRLGVFDGRRTFENTKKKPFRVTARAEYNLRDIDPYAGTTLGEYNVFTFGGGIDKQGTYVGMGADMFIDQPLGRTGSITANVAYSYLNGGNDPNAKYSFAELIPEQNIWFCELGYYFKKVKLQPWIKFERQDTHEKLTTTNVYGGGLNYFFNGYKANVRLSYIAMNKTLLTEAGGTTNKTFGQVWLQVQLCYF